MDTKNDAVGNLICFQLQREIGALHNNSIVKPLGVIVLILSTSIELAYHGNP